MSGLLRHNRYMILAVAVTLSTGAMAQSASLLPELQRLALPVESKRLADFEPNPSAMFYRDSVSLSTLSFSADRTEEEKPVMEQLGDGHLLFGLSAGSYSRLGQSSVVWGDAAFTTGSYRDVRWSDCIDYRRIAPYVLGDEAGGNLSTRCYSFSGGYAKNIGRWSAGVEAGYRAEIAYRNRDPRVKTVVSDLDISIGASYEVNSGHVIGLDADLNVYNQNCDLDFYSPVNEINTYTLTGLGTYYRRFMGNTNKNSGYSSLGYAIGLQFLPIKGERGLSATVKYGHYRMEQQLRNFNNLTLGFTDNDLIDFCVGYSAGLSRTLLIRPSIEGMIHRRRGTENLFGTSAGASYDKIGSRSPYSCDNARFGLSLPLQIAFGRTTYVTLNPNLSFENETEGYSEPYRHLQVSHLIPGLKADLSAVSSGIWLWNFSLEGSFAKASAETPVLTDLETDTALGQCVLSNYSMLCADRTSLGAMIGISRPVSSFILSLSASYGFTDYCNEGVCHCAVVTLSAKF
ncbi:DUF6850 family outer membrane beta-barrel protein [uncultured Duncaniella sp.]|uniref:DUF6850 family outer membrane beta-barrel protein n=1 Tax=uncultured Duncaniella sp. TaxID=2768039 RepID=UPI0025B6859C|nr:DUF6850 family outer membrane beta-barrel protein [uncultured Duncaniella sp.]